ncbi:hypothetical protein [Microbacterium immunditiarum]|uniref:Uncharacterized protein n=1 Tax=Microbacterium immunditiarum TaxID=337480 RepID=A0A7Y9GRH7_9MICO|nr:hypothetical protein [Microbacterium immunditiarum]NYE21348.1 hypothetical protein [Microbacterium immunditiarum]
MDDGQPPTPPPPPGGPVRKPVALAFATVAFIALEIAGLGMASLLLDEDVVASSGLGPWPAIASTGLATIVFGAGLALALRPDPPSYWSAAWIALATALAYVGGAWFGCLFAGADLAVAGSVAGRIATSWFGVVVLAAAAVSAWGGIALTRTRARRPLWPWEDDEDR